MRDVVLAVDAGTTGITVQAIDRDCRLVAREYSEFPQYYPQPGWVEHDPLEIRDTVVRLVRSAIAKFDGSRLAGIGITNQRETTVVWERATGRPIHRAIVWQCRRTAPMCEALRKRGVESDVRAKTGLVLDAYFSGTKLRWLLEEVAGAKSAAKAGKLAFGTIDSWLIWCLTGGKSHATDYTNASRTMLLDIGRKAWDGELLKLFGAHESMLPRLETSSGTFGMTDRGAVGLEVPIAGNAGDQQAALFGQGCVDPGAMKNTYGTGCFILLNTGAKRIRSRRGLLTTLACDGKGRPVYALEGSVFIAGAAVQWLRDELKIITKASETEVLARSIASNEGVYVVPAFVGLGAPHWDMAARGVVCGLTRGSGRAHLARAVLESIAYQTADVLESMKADSGIRPKYLRVDGGAVANDFLMHFQADILGLRVVRPKNVESTALGAAFLAGLGTGLWSDMGAIQLRLEMDKVFDPQMKAAERRRLLDGWRAAVRRARVT